MIALIIFLAVALLFVLLLVSRVSLTIKYRGGMEDLELHARVIFFKIRIYPKRKTERLKSMSRRRAERIKKELDKKKARKKAKKEEKRLKKEAKKKAKTAAKAKKRMSITKILDILSLVIGIVQKLNEKFIKHLRIKIARIKIKIGTGDAANTAIAYGAVTQSINVLFPLLEGIKNFKLPKGDEIDVCADFTAEESEMEIFLSFSISVWRVLSFAVASFFELIKYFFKVQKRKESQAESRAPSNKTKTVKKFI